MLFSLFVFFVNSVLVIFGSMSLIIVTVHIIVSIVHIVSIVDFHAVIPITKVL